MGNLINLPNITPDSINEAEESQRQKVKTSTFDVKNYLNVRLAKDEEEKTITIRLLPSTDSKSPFTKVHVHNVKVPQDLVKDGEKPYKSYICLSKNEDIDHEKFGTKCPYCELNREAYNESIKETDPLKKKDLQKISIDNKSTEAVIVRCIERGKEDEGVKFWKFNIRNDKTDPYNQMMKLYQKRKEAAEKKGKTENIFDIYEGKDLDVTITKEGTSAPTIIDASDRSPLSEDEEQMRQWIFDEKKWQDVFTCKPYEYLELVSQMRIPWFDNKSGKWVDKEEYDSEHNINTKDIDNSINSANESIRKMTEENITHDEVERNTIVNSLSVNDDELPF